MKGIVLLQCILIIQILIWSQNIKKNLKKLMHQPHCPFETYIISHEDYVTKVYFHKANKIIYGCFYPNIILFVTTCNKIGYI